LVFFIYSFVVSYFLENGSKRLCTARSRLYYNTIR
jgi:hypothetical protein